MKNQEKKKSKKKILLSYLILAVCLLVIAAVTVSVVFTVNRNGGGDITIDTPDDSENPKEPDDDDKEPENPVNTATDFILPTSSGTVALTYEDLCHTDAGQYRAHMGIDFAGTAGDSVCAVLDGEVTAITENISPNNITEGGVITLTHANGITSTYMYIDTASNLKIGDKVNRGDVIGTIAKACGNEESFGDHLHFELKVNGDWADPVVYLDIAEK